MKLLGARDSIHWDGVPANASFAVQVPLDSKCRSHAGTATVSSMGIMIAKLTFSIVLSPVPDNAPTNRSMAVEYPKSAFASYASPDSLEVLHRIQGIKAIRPDLEVFVDALTLRSGQNWKQQLEAHVPTKDIFYLFWSEHAANSSWVTAEWQLALERQGLDYIHPIPLVSPHSAPPPAELAALHFSDPELAHILGAKQALQANGRAW